MPDSVLAPVPAPVAGVFGRGSRAGPPGPACRCRAREGHWVLVSTRPRVRAPELVGRGWLNTGGAQLHLGELRGRFVLLDFWTFCCVNCLHVLEELRPLEARFADVLTVVGVHSPKFVHEADPGAVVAAVERYAVHHPVLDDPDLTTWKQYAIRAWPTLVLVDPDGYVVHVASGEGHVEGIGRLLEELVPQYAISGESPYVAPPRSQGDLSFPGKLLRLPDGRVLVSDSS